MNITLLIIQLIIAFSLIGLILLQSSKGGLQSSIGGPDYYRTKRGTEKIIFTATIIAAIIFFIVTVINGLVA